MERGDIFWNLLARKVSGEASEQELIQLEAFLEENPDLIDISNALQTIWGYSEEPDADFLEATYLLQRRKMEDAGLFSGVPENYTAPESNPTRGKLNIAQKWLTGIAGIFMLALSAWYFGFLQNGSQNQQVSANTTTQKEVSAKPASKTKLALPDGTIVWLNSGSKLTYDSWTGKSSREVFLTGEAFFDVTKNPSKPFIIHTKHIHVKVLGTSFNVKAYPDDKVTETSLIHGSVEVSLHRQPNKIFKLVPNQKLVVQNTILDVSDKKDLPIDLKQTVAILPLKPIQLANLDAQLVETGWLNNLLLFEDASFGEIAKKMERWYDVQIQFSNKALEDLRMTGSFEKETLIQAIDALRYISNFNYKVENDLITIY